MPETLLITLRCADVAFPREASKTRHGTGKRDREGTPVTAGASPPSPPPRLPPSLNPTVNVVLEDCAVVNESSRYCEMRAAAAVIMSTLIQFGRRLEVDAAAGDGATQRDDEEEGAVEPSAASVWLAFGGREWLEEWWSVHVAAMPDARALHPSRWCAFVDAMCGGAADGRPRLTGVTWQVTAAMDGEAACRDIVVLLEGRLGGSPPKAAAPQQSATCPSVEWRRSDVEGHEAELARVAMLAWVQATSTNGMPFASVLKRGATGSNAECGFLASDGNDGRESADANSNAAQPPLGGTSFGALSTLSAVCELFSMAEALVLLDQTCTVRHDGGSTRRVLQRAMRQIAFCAREPKRLTSAALWSMALAMPPTAAAHDAERSLAPSETGSQVCRPLVLSVLRRSLRSWQRFTTLFLQCVRRASVNEQIALLRTPFPEPQAGDDATMPLLPHLWSAAKTFGYSTIPRAFVQSFEQYCFHHGSGSPFTLRHCDVTVQRPVRPPVEHHANAQPYFLVPTAVDLRLEGGARKSRLGAICVPIVVAAVLQSTDDSATGNLCASVSRVVLVWVEATEVESEAIGEHSISNGVHFRWSGDIAVRFDGAFSLVPGNGGAHEQREEASMVWNGSGVVERTASAVSAGRSVGTLQSVLLQPRCGGAVAIVDPFGAAPWLSLRSPPRVPVAASFPSPCGHMPWAAIGRASQDVVSAEEGDALWEAIFL